MRSWACKYDNQKLSKEGIKLKTQAAIVMISGQVVLRLFKFERAQQKRTIQLRLSQA
ncbi:hypothetical protein OXYTRIMIC_021 [Oxytricha trifallax]|uniref:Uncharacterized protein n=1 Tax=Oxytricha trifallax TaxID=1172189 RepID=A0A073HZU3_9SPIT|nr:hypothetical protein OXYTRIMIC_021 [Oxytricha trifallax]